MMWRCYGNDGNGLALVFEIEKPNKLASSYLLGKVEYGNNSKAKLNFEMFLKFDEDFRKQHPGVIQNTFFNEILMIALLLKTNIWKKEKEIRLIGFHNYDDYSLKTITHDIKNSTLSDIYHTMDGNGIHKAFLKLRLAGTEHFNSLKDRLSKIDPSYPINKLTPILRLKKVIIGYRLLQKWDNKAIIILNKLVEKYDQKPIGEFSRLNKYF